MLSQWATKHLEEQLKAWRDECHEMDMRCGCGNGMCGKGFCEAEKHMQELADEIRRRRESNA